jgi:hypothetical protein
MIDVLAPVIFWVAMLAIFITRHRRNNKNGDTK